METRTTQREAAAEVRGVVSAFLEGSQITNQERLPDSLFSCEVQGVSDYLLGLADHEILEISVQGDTAVATVALTSVAEASGSPTEPDLQIAVVGVRMDTARWRLTFDHENQRWGICGFSLEGIDFIWGGMDVRRKWEPEGASLGMAQSMADSVGRSKE